MVSSDIEKPPLIAKTGAFLFCVVRPPLSVAEAPTWYGREVCPGCREIMHEGGRNNRLVMRRQPSLLDNHRRHLGTWPCSRTLSAPWSTGPDYPETAIQQISLLR